MRQATVGRLPRGALLALLGIPSAALRLPVDWRLQIRWTLLATLVLAATGTATVCAAATAAGAADGGIANGSPTKHAAAPPAPPPPPASSSSGATADQPSRHVTTTADVLANSTAADWRPLDPQNTLYMELPAGRVIIELSQQFAPHHVANIEALTREGYYDGTAIVRSQDNYVVQWADPENKKPIKNAQRKVAAEFERTSRGIPFTPLVDPDTYAPEVGFSDGFPAARDPKVGRAWLVHCYGMVGAGRDNDVDSGGGAQLYAATGHAPRHLDRNATLVGRVVQGMELLSTLPRGTGDQGYYEKPEQRVAIKSIRVVADVPPSQRTDLEVLRTDTPTFTAYVEARRNRREAWFKVPAGHVDVCNVPIVTRPRGTAAGK